MVVSMFMILFKALALLSNFAAKSVKARYLVVCCFIKKDKVTEEAGNFMAVCSKRLLDLISVQISSSIWIKLQFIFQ
jgi:hypothetical protein